MQDLVAGFPFLLKLNAWIFSSRGSDLIYRELLQQFFPTSSLLRFRGVGTKPLYEFLQFLTFIFYLFVLIELLFRSEERRVGKECRSCWWQSCDMAGPVEQLMC